jgi:hypothetical protein
MRIFDGDYMEYEQFEIDFLEEFTNAIEDQRIEPEFHDQIGSFIKQLVTKCYEQQVEPVMPTIWYFSTEREIATEEPSELDQDNIDDEVEMQWHIPNATLVVKIDMHKDLVVYCAGTNELKPPNSKRSIKGKLPLSKMPEFYVIFQKIFGENEK